MIKQPLYIEDIKKVAEDSNLNFETMKNKTILITGGTGLICSFLIDVLMYRNKYYNDNIIIYTISRSEEKVINRFKEYEIEKYSDNNHSNLIYINQDISNKLNIDVDIDYIVHGASNTHPRAYSQDPVGTITANVFGLYNLLEYGNKHNVERVFLMSSVEIYGENRGDIEEFFENYLGYIDCNTVRAGYPESKRVCESLCQAYISKFDMDIVIGRLSRVYGPTMQIDDSKALAQFINKAVNNENIVLKSAGEQYYSYCYVADAVDAMLKIIFDGQKGETYNIATSNMKLKDLATILAKYNNKQVIYELPDDVEKKGYSTATKAILNSDKLKSIGWVSQYEIKDGLEKTIQLIKKIK